MVYTNFVTSTDRKLEIETADILLADVAVRIQLPPSLYDVATDRYETIRKWIEREGSPLAGRVIRFYPQGSMAINATIAAWARNDEFDIDVVAELDLPAESDPQLVLDLLFHAIRGERGSRYYNMTKRQSRCVTIEYADMHLDVTPVVRRPLTPERESIVFHHKPETPHVRGTRHVANPWGLADWFKAQTPPDKIIAQMFLERMAFDGQVRADAAADPVPNQTPVQSKSKALIALQLVKRFRNLRYERRKDRRQPPSVALVKLIGDRADSGTTRLLHEVIYQAQYMLDVLKQSRDFGRLVHLTNPWCQQDVLTDRWPEDKTAQDLFIEDLEYFVDQLARLDNVDLEDARVILADLFGEAAGTEVVKKFIESSTGAIRDGRSAHVAGAGRFAAPAAAAVVSSPSRAEPTKPHRFYGGGTPPWKRR